MVFLDLLSLSVNILCLIQKLPQIIRIFKTKNVDSVSVSSVLLEETAYTLVLTYNLWRKYQLSAFFEYIFLFIQDILLLWALAKYSTKGKDKNTNPSKPIYGIIIFCLYLTAAYLDVIPAGWMNICTFFVIPIGATSKIIQLRTIISNKSAGQVTPTGWAIAAYSNLARIITNMVQTKDMNMVINLLISLILNTSVVIACVVYANNKQPKSIDKTKKKTT